MDASSPWRPQQVLRASRRARGLTQVELAELSLETSAPFAREFVAQLETRGLPGTVRKFLNYAWLTNSDVGLVAELEALALTGRDELLPTRDALAACRRHSEAGDTRGAVGVALAALHAAPAPEGNDRGKLLVAASIAAKRGGFPRLGRELCERALEEQGLAPAERARAALVLISCLAQLDRPQQARAFFSLVDRRLFDESPELGAAYWHDCFLIETKSGDPSAALKAAELALRFYEITNFASDWARLLGARARLLAERGRLDEADADASEAIARAHASEDQNVLFRALYNAGFVALKRGELELAEERAEEARELAEREGHEVHAFEATLLRLQIARGCSDERLVSVLCRELARRARATRLTPEVERAFRRELEEQGTAPPSSGHS